MKHLLDMSSKKKKSVSREIADLLNAGASISDEEAQKRIQAIAKRSKRESERKASQMLKRIEKEIRKDSK